MLRNFLVVAARVFLRQRSYSIMNVFGLSTGIASALLILLWISSELRVDTGYQDSERIYRVMTNLSMSNNEILTWTITPGPLAEAIREEIPEVELAARTMSNGSKLYQYEDKAFLEPTLHADSTFFQILTFKTAAGDLQHLDRSGMAISRKLATSLFGDEDPIGKVVKVAGQYDLEVRGVFEDIKDESSLKFESIIPFDIYKKERGDGFNWGNFDHPLYVRLHANASPTATIQKINDLADRRIAKLGEDRDGTSLEFFMMGLNDYYLNSNFVNGVTVGGRIQYVKVFSIVAAFIVVIACINFMNMSTARALGRAKEVGIRKVVGAQRRSLIYQFMGEAFITTVIALIIALCIVYAVLPGFNTIVSRHIQVDLTSPSVLLICLSILLVTTVLSGSYPAFVLSSFVPASVLKGTLGSGTQRATMRKALVVFQFSLTVIMIASAVIVQRQINFIRTKNLGYDRTNVLSFYAPGDVSKRFEAFRTEASSIPGVEIVSRGGFSLVSINNQTRSVEWQGKPADANIYFRNVVVDQGYLEAMNVTLLEGRFFNNSVSDSASYVVSKRAVEVMGLLNPIGSNISVWGFPGTIVGVVDDIYGRSLHEPMDPLTFMCRPQWASTVFVRYEPGATQNVVAQLEQLFKQFAPEYPFRFSFLDEDFERLYNTDKTTGTLALGFTAIAIVISILGLVALAAYTAERKKKEIGIRKTLGASVSTIVSLMTRDFVKLSLFAALIGCPVAWLLMDKFLEGYVYHMELNADTFLITAILVMTLSLITVIFMVVRAAVANPVNALRSE